MIPQKVFYCGSNAQLLHVLRTSSGGTLQVEQIPESFPFQDLAHMPDVGLLVLQHEPSATDSFASLRHWRHEKPAVPVLVLTSDYSPDTMKDLMRWGAVEVLPLPADGKKVLACYEAFLPGFRQPVPIAIGEDPSEEAPAPLAQAWRTPSERDSSAPTEVLQAGNPQGSGLEINYFGLLQIRLHGQKIEFNWQAKMLFAYLAYHASKALSRDHLARVFWPEKHENQPECARRSLNVELNHIRKALREQTGLEQDLIVFDNNCYRLQLEHPIQSDVTAFKALYQKVQALQREGHALPDKLFLTVIQTYSSNFLDDCPEDALNWVEVERQYLGALFEQMADLYSAQLSDKGEYYQATSICHEILSRDQRMEAIHRRMMFCYGKLGMCHKVEQQYRLLCQIMEREFQSKPSAETTRLYLQIKRQEVG